VFKRVIFILCVSLCVLKSYCVLLKQDNCIFLLETLLELIHGEGRKISFLFGRKKNDSQTIEK